MRCLSRFLSSCLIVLLLCTAAARGQEADSTYTTDTAVNTGAADDASATTDEAPKPVPVTYNKATPTDAQWQQLVSDKAFGYKREQEFVPVKNEAPQEDPWLLRALIAILKFFGSTLGHLLLWALLALLVGFVLYRILAGEGRIFGRRNQRHGQEEAPESDITEEDLLHNDWAARLREALAAGNTRMAIRYSYMQLLQILQARDLIAYRQDKTNTAYYHELSGNAIRQEFRQLTRQYEYAWYGNFLPSTDGFDAYMQTFNGVKKQLGAS